MKLDLRDQILTSNQVVLSYFFLKLLFCYLCRSSGEVCYCTVVQRLYSCEHCFNFSWPVKNMAVGVKISVRTVPKFWNRRQTKQKRHKTIIVCCSHDSLRCLMANSENYNANQNTSLIPRGNCSHDCTLFK